MSTVDEHSRLLLAERFMALGPEKRELFLARLRQQGVSAAELPIPRAASMESAPLTHAQERLWFLWRLSPDSAAYNISGSMRLRGPLRLDALQSALELVVTRHDALRSSVFEEDGLPRQRLTDARLSGLPLIDLSAASSPLAAAEQRATELMRQPFDLTAAPLLRASVLRLDAEDHVLVLCVHHIAADGWSLDVIMREVATSYAAQLSGRDIAMPVPDVRYLDYAHFSRAIWGETELAHTLPALCEGLGDVDNVLELPRPAGARAQSSSDAAGSFSLAVPAPLVARLNQFARARGWTLFPVLLAAFGLLLSRYSGQRQLRIGVPAANRSRSQLQNVVGMFVNTLVMPIEISGGASFAEYVACVERELRRRQASQDFPFERLVEALAPERSLDRNPVFQALYNHQQRDRSAHALLPGLSAELMPWGTAAAQVDLSLDTEQEGSDTLSARFTYAAQRVSREIVEHIAHSWLELLEAGCADPSQRVSALAQVQVAHAQPDAPAYVPVTELIRQRARLQPNAPALCEDDGSAQLSYRQLMLRTRQLAAALRALAGGRSQDVRVAVQLERSAELIVAELAVLEAGFAFVPIDPQLPVARGRELLTAARPQLLWCDQAASEELLSGTQTRAIDTAALEAHIGAETALPVPHPEQLAYLIFTSGSTGAPKGVAMTHGSLSMHIRAIAERYGMTSSDCALHFAAASFDASIEQWLSPLVSGAQLVMRGPTLYSAERALDVLRERGVTWFEMPPAYLIEVCRAALERGETLALRACSAGGEALSRQGFDVIMRALAGAPLVNGYGPTETAITPLTWTAQAGDAFDCAYAPIGDAVGARTLYVLDADLCPVPDGVIGELYLGAGGLARGYFDRAALTAERFLPDPWSASGGRMYRTGDQVRRRVDHTLEFMGRSDHQVKLRGYRIELGEIESRLVACPGVREAVVLTRGKGDVERLVAYVGLVPRQTRQHPCVEVLGSVPTFKTGDFSRTRARARKRARLSVSRVRSPQIVYGHGHGHAYGRIWGQPLVPPELQDISEALRTALQAQLPAYMVPSAIVCMPQLPRTVSGKVDRRALPDPVVRSASQRVRPRTANELVLAAVLCDVLKLSEVFVEDNFFELGGDSIVALQVISRARAAGLSLTPKDVFMHQNLAALAAAAKPLTAANSSSEEPAGELQLSPIAHAFFQQAWARPDHFNQALLLAVDEPLELSRLSRALAAVVAHHDALRLRFDIAADGTVSQRYAVVEEHNDDLLRTATARDQAQLDSLYEQTQCSLSLARGPLLRALHVKRADGSTRLLIAVHHLVIDGVSWRVLVEDLFSAYQQLKAADTVQLPDKTASWSAFSRGLAAWAQDDARLQRELAYYRTQLSGAFAELPVRSNGGSARVRDRAFSEIHLDHNLTQRLLRESPSAYRTQIQELLLTALGRALFALTGRSRALIELESHGRQGAELSQPALDLSRTLGWFTCLYPVCLDVAGELSDAIVQVKESLRRVPHQGLGYGLLTQHGGAELRTAIQQLPAARITFNYQGQFAADQSNVTGLRPVHEPHGPLCDPNAPLGNWLEINGQVFDGTLSFTLAYSRELYARTTVEALGESFLAELTTVIEHTTRRGVGTLTPSDLSYPHLSRAQLAELTADYPGLCEVHRLTPLQHGLLFQSLLEPELGTYVSQLDLRVERLDLERFVKAFQQVLASHESLRAAFVHEGLAEPLQVIVRDVRLPVEEHDWRGVTQADALEVQLRALSEAERARGVPLTEAPLMRLCAVRLDAGAYHIIWTHHHLVLDGWSTSILWAEVLRAYAGEMPSQPIDAYRDYLAWLDSRDRAASERYFREMLARAQDCVTLASATYVPPAHGRPHFQRLRKRLGEPEAERLQRFARRKRVTVNSIVQAAFGYLLQRYTDCPGALFGVTVAGRPAELPGAEAMIGMFINTVPVYVSGRAHESVSDLLQRLQRENLELREHEHTALYEIQRWADRPGKPLFDALLVFENYPASSTLEVHGAALGVRRIRSVEQTEFPLTLAVRFDRELTLDFGFTPALSADFVEGFSRRLLAVLDQFIERPQQSLGTLALFGAAVAADHAPNRRPDGRSVPLAHQQIAAHALQRPAAPALRGTSSALSFGELRARVVALSNRLARHGVRPEQLVGVCCGRSPEAIIAVLAAWELGAAFVPLDAELPTERLRLLIEDAAVSALITTRALREHAGVHSALPTLCSDDDCAADSGMATMPSSQIDPRQLAYVLYTSGTTGKPKGVAVSHGALAAHCKAISERFAMRSSDRMLLFAPMSFDASFDQWLVPLTRSAEVHVMEELWEPERMHEELLARGVTCIETTPSYMSQLAQAAAERGPLPQLRMCAVGGEAVTPQALAEIQRALAPQILMNAYGPTEAVVTTSTWDWNAAASVPRTAYAPLGAADADRELMVLDAHLEPVAQGVTGELFITGSVLARGYHARAGLTAERFLPGPGGKRIYRSGDRARFLPDGTLEFLGRRDHQVKLRGVRVELGELEAALRAEEGVSDAAAIVRDEQGARMLHAVVAAGGEPLDPRALQESVRRKLPAQLWPAQITVLEALPRTAIGKLDRARLALLPLARRAYRAPASETQRQLAKLFEELLSTSDLGLDDDFFEQGGDSLLAMRLCARIKQELGVSLSLAALLRAPSIGALADHLAQLMSNDTARELIDDALAELMDMDEEALTALLQSEEERPIG